MFGVWKRVSFFSEGLRYLKVPRRKNAIWNAEKGGKIMKRFTLEETLMVYCHLHGSATARGQVVAICVGAKNPFVERIGPNKDLWWDVDRRPFPGDKSPCVVAGILLVNFQRGVGCKANPHRTLLGGGVSCRVRKKTEITRWYPTSPLHDKVALLGAMRTP